MEHLWKEKPFPSNAELKYLWPKNKTEKRGEMVVVVEEI